LAQPFHLSAGFGPLWEYHHLMEVDTSGWSGDGEFTQRLIDALGRCGFVSLLKVEDAPASRADAGFSFISNELFVMFECTARVVRTRRFGIIPGSAVVREKTMTLEGLEAALEALPDVGPPDYSDEGMLQYLRAERVIPAYQTRGYKLIELVRVYEAGTVPRREP
jgi:hypothetical protein